MNNKSPIVKVIIILLVFIGLGSILRFGASAFKHDDVVPVKKNTVLQMDLKGVILNGKKFLTTLKKYKEDNNVKALVININSPGGAVGPSQEISAEIKRFREETKKPVICVSTGIMASGAYYAAAACDKIVVAPGALIGSIGVIMEFANLEKLYDWAKVQRFAITSGKFKDSGAEFRTMRDEERAYFQELINDTYKQFRSAVMEGRKLKDDTMDAYADGRVFNGSKAVELGFADKEGYLQDAIQLAADEAKLGSDYEVFEVKKKKKSIWEMGFGGDEEEDDLNSLDDFSKYIKGSSSLGLDHLYKKVLRAEFLNQPMMLMPGYWE